MRSMTNDTTPSHHQVPRDLYDAFVGGLAKAGFDERGYPQGWSSPADAPWPEFATDTGRFVVCPYVWDDDVAKLDLPNLLDRQTGLEIRWYKYPLRDAYANKPLDERGVVRLMADLARETASLGARAYDPNVDLELATLESDTNRRTRRACATGPANEEDEALMARFREHVTSLHRQPRGTEAVAYVLEEAFRSNPEHVVWAETTRDETGAPTTRTISIRRERGTDEFVVEDRTTSRTGDKAPVSVETHRLDADGLVSSRWWALVADRMTTDAPDPSELSPGSVTRDDRRLRVRGLDVTLVGHDALERREHRGTTTLELDVDPIAGSIGVGVRLRDGTTVAIRRDTAWLVRAVLLAALDDAAIAHVSLDDELGALSLNTVASSTCVMLDDDWRDDLSRAIAEHEVLSSLEEKEVI